MSFHGSDSALGSSNLYLDGIPFKLGEKFKRPPKVSMPESITQSTVTAALTEEYSFSTEEAVLSWLADVHHAEEVKKEQDLAKAQAELENPSNISSEDEDETEVKEINDLKNWNDQAVSNKNSSWSNPVLANFSSDLLKPTQFISNSSSLAQTTSNTVQHDFDIRSFDKVDDPFDNLELQVIDDLEELQTILQSAPRPVNGENTTPKTLSDKADDVNNSQGPKVSLRKNAVRLKRDKVLSSPGINSSTDSSLINDNSPDYMNVQPLQVDLNQKHDETRNLPTMTNSHFDNRQGQVVALPPILRGTKTTSLFENTGNIGGTESVRPNSNPELLLLGNGPVSFKTEKRQYDNVVVDTSQTNAVQGNKENFYSRHHSISADYVNVEVLNKTVLRHNCDPADLSPLTKNGLRGARSTPSLVHHDPPTSGSTGVSPPPRPSSQQLLLEDKDLAPLSEISLLKKKSANSTTYENVHMEQSEETALKQYFCDVAPVPPIPKPRNVQPKPLRPQPAKRELVTAEPNKTECVQQNSIKTETVTQDLVHQQNVKPEPLKTEHVQPQPVKPEHVQSQPVKPEHFQSQPVKPGPLKTEPVQSQPVKPEHFQSQPVKPGPLKTEPVQSQPVKPESSRPKSVQQQQPVKHAILTGRVQADSVEPEPVRHKQKKGEETEGRVVGRSTFYENVEINNTLEEVTWNKYSPLPPPKTQTKQTVPVLPPRSSKETRGGRSSSLSSSPDVFSRAADSEDPYSSLSIEAQAFVSSLTGMGFPRARAARAVLKLGQDHKLVVEHLCLINTMVEKGYAAPLSEMALHLFTNDFNKAVKYLDLFLQFQELGFQNEKIREALVSNDIDRDKALDFLTA